MKRGKDRYWGEKRGEFNSEAVREEGGEKAD